MVLFNTAIFLRSLDIRAMRAYVDYSLGNSSTFADSKFELLKLLESATPQSVCKMGHLQFYQYTLLDL